MRPTTPSWLCRLIVLVFLLVKPAFAQCTPQWLPGDGVPGVIGAVNVTTMWDPDGAGPLPPRLVIGGDFEIAGNALANNIATYDPANGTWSALGSGIEGTGTSVNVRALAVMPNGDLVAGGWFTTAGGVAANSIARWNGSAWSALGIGMPGASFAVSVNALAVLPNGDLVAGGMFTTAGGVPANRIARWDGSAWSPLGSGMSSVVRALAVLPNGDLVAGGAMTTAGGVPVNRIARWDGSAWSALGSGIPGTSVSVNALAVLPNGDLVAGGDFATAGGVATNGIARWDGIAWSTLGGGMNLFGRVIALAALPNGELVAAGPFTTAGGVAANSIALWNGSTWGSLGNGVNSGIRALAVLPNGNLVAGGQFTFAGSFAAGGVTASGLARWDGSAWSALATGMNEYVYSLAALPNGDLVAGGRFTTVAGFAANRIARWDGNAWSALGSGIGTNFVNFTEYVSAIAVLPNGDLVAGGNFTTAGGVAANRIARWDGNAWSALGSGIGSSSGDGVGALAVLPNGDIVAAGNFTTAGGVAANRIARWDGTAWSALGSGIGSATSDIVNALAVLPNGDLVAGGFFTTAGGVAANRIARWDGSTWSALGSGLSGGVNALAVLPNGHLVAGGAFTTAGGVPANCIARWNGTAWSALGTGTNLAVSSIARLPNGDLVAGGVFTSAGGVPAHAIARWDGSAWSALGSNMVYYVFVLASAPNGQLAVGGSFLTAGGQVSAHFARYATPCPATANGIGAGCLGPAGPLTLVADTLPWTGSTLQTTGSGLLPTSFALQVVGFASSPISLSLITPLALPGCDLLASPDLVQLLPGSGGSVVWSLPIPNNPSWAGIPLFTQVLQFDPLAPASLSSSNGLSLTIGTF